MADLKISALNSLAGADLVAADVVAVVDDSASETKKLTVSDLIANGVTLISNSTIPSAKILFAAGSVATASVADAGITTAKVADDAITAAKLADNSSVTLVSTLPGSGSFVGQVALDTDDSKVYVWSGSAWTSVKGAGSINVVNGSTTGEINIVASTSGDTVTISATLDNTTAAAQFLGGPTGAGGAVGYRALVGTDLPTPTTSTKGGVIVNGEGLRMDSDTIEVDNDVTANSSTYQAVQFNSKGLITAGRDITAADLPNATSGAVGAVKPGSGLSMGSAGAINHTNAVTGATNTKITFDAQGHVTAGTSLSASDIPDLDTAKVTTGTFPTARIADDAVTADKLGDKSTATIAEITPTTGDFIGQLHLNSITRDLFLYDGNVWQPIGISVGEIVLAGTYNASTNLVATVTAEGTAVGYTVGAALPAASTSNKGHYVIVSEAGTGTSPAPTVALNPPDFLLSTGTAYTEIDVSDTVTAQQASNIGFSPAGGVASTNVQGAIEEVDTEKAPKASPTFTGTVALGEDAVMTFEGATSNDFETTLTVTDPTADRTITLPNVTGTVVTTGDTGSVTSTMITDGTIVNADINASAEIAVSKLANGSARQLLQTASNGTDVEFTSNVDVPGTLDVTGAATLDSTLGVAGVISADGKVKFPAGSASAPSFYSGTDTDTGLYFSAADEISVATGGTQRVVVDSSGRLLCGTSSNFVRGNVQVIDNGGGELTIGRSDTSVSNGNDLGHLYFASSAGGTGNACAAIECFADADQGSSDFPTRLTFSTTADGASSPSERFRIDSSGNVGIGETSMDALLVIKGDSDANTTPSIRLKDGSDTREAWISNTGGDLVLNVGGNDNVPHGTIKLFEGGLLTFSQEAGERFRCDSSGNVGIGTSPVTGSGWSRALHVHAASSGSHISFTDSTTGTGVNDGLLVGQYQSDAYIVNREAGSLAFYTSNAEKMRIDSSGRVAIGATSTTSQLRVIGDEIRFSNSSNASYYGTITHDAGTTGANIYNSVDATAVSHIWQNSGTEKMRLDSSGRVGIGNTPGNFDANADNLVVGSGSGSNGITIYSGNDSLANFYFADGTSTAAEHYAGGLNYNHSTNQLSFFTNGGQTRMYIDSVGMQVNYRDTSTVGVGLLQCNSDHGGTNRAQWYVLSNGTNENRTGTYTTISSDERMKKDIVDATSQWEDIKNIRMRKFRYKADADNAPLQLGVVAQELETVCPNLVTRKPATAEMSAESEGLIAEGEDILSWKQSIVHLKALKALQEAMDRIETLEAKVAALEAE